MLKPKTPDAPPHLLTFDASEFWRHYGDGLPPSQAEAIRAHLETHGGEQRREVEALPSALIQILLRDVAVKSFLALLSSKPFFELKRTAFKGFQAVPSLIRQPTVQKRLLQHFQTHRADLHAVLLLWAYGFPTPPVVEAVRRDDATPGSELTLRLIREFGITASLLAITTASWRDEFDFALHLFDEPQELADVLESAPSNSLIQSPVESREIDWQSRALAAERDAEAAHQSVASLQKKVAEFGAMRSQLVGLQAEITRTQSQNKQLATQWEKKFENATQKLQSELDELKRQHERQTRRFKAIESEKDELETENRKLKKQLRHTQGLVEEERKKLTQYEKRAATPKDDPTTPVKPQKTPSKPAKTVPLTPYDEIFEWMADGRKVRVTPREMRRLIDANDEDSVFALMLALEALAASSRPVDAEIRHRFLHRMREMAPFYARVLTHTTTRVLVDASNVARSQLTRYNKGQLSLLLQMRDELRRLDYWPIVFIADASLRHHIDQGKVFTEMIERGEIIQGDKGVEADELLAREARRTGATVVTNDARFFHKVSPDFEPPRLTFRVMDGAVFVNEM